MTDIILISHPSRLWHGARHLHVAETGKLIAIARTNPLRVAATRLIEEGFDASATMIIRDSDGIAPDVSAAIKSALA